jgi:hypothetical protein
VSATAPVDVATTRPSGSVSDTWTHALSLLGAREATTSTSTPMVPMSSWTAASMRTSPSRAVLQATSRAGRQMPDVVSFGPQSQPQLLAILRT